MVLYEQKLFQNVNSAVDGIIDDLIKIIFRLNLHVKTIGYEYFSVLDE